MREKEKCLSSSGGHIWCPDQRRRRYSLAFITYRRRQEYRQAVVLAAARELAIGCGKARFALWLDWWE